MSYRDKDFLCPPFIDPYNQACIHSQPLYLCVSAFLAHLYLKLSPTWLLHSSPGLLSDPAHTYNSHWKILFAGTKEAQSEKMEG